MMNHRINYWDNLKFFLIFLVVLGHFISDYNMNVFNAIYIYIYSFHMPLFIFVAGVFHNNHNVKKRIIQLLSYYIIMKIIIVLINVIFKGSSFYFSLLSEGAIPWFMLVLAIYSGLMYFLRNVKFYKLIIISVLIALLTGYDQSIGDFLSLSRVIVFFPFYICGSKVAEKKIRELSSHKRNKIIAATVHLIWLIFCFRFSQKLDILIPFFKGRFGYGEDYGIMGGVYRLMVMVLAAVLCFTVLMLIPSRKLSILSTFGTRTIQVYTWHFPMLFILQFFQLPDWLFQNFGAIGKIIWILSAFLVTMLLSMKLFRYPSQWVFHT